MTFDDWALRIASCTRSGSRPQTSFSAAIMASDLASLTLPLRSPSWLSLGRGLGVKLPSPLPFLGWPALAILDWFCRELRLLQLGHVWLAILISLSRSLTISFCIRCVGSPVLP